MKRILASVVVLALFFKFANITCPFAVTVFEQDARKIILDALEINLAGKWLERYTSEPHLAGTNYGLVEFTANKFEEYGFKPTIDPYDIYVSYPQDHDLHLLKDGKSVYQAPLKEDELKEDSTSSGDDTIPTFLGYAANGNVTSQFVYVNYGTKEDFAKLKSLGIDLTGKIAIARYGAIFRGLKVKFAQDAGAIGVLLYSDPGDDRGITPANGFKQYPHGPARHESSVQRGSVQFLGGIGAAPGDPTTPGYPSKKGAKRKDPHKSIGKIPALPISYREVKPILEKLNGHGEQVESWKGELDGFKYFTGPNPEFELNLYNHQVFNITTMWNVYGEIEGINKDEVIVIGNHRDAWIKGGAGDPNSGSAVLLEVARALAALKKAGYKFKRSIVLQSYDGEEYGLLGSTEAGEYFAEKYQKTVVAYFNLDSAVTGKNLHLSASPVLNHLLRSVAKQIDYPDEKVGTVYDHLVSRGDRISILGSGSDYTVFLEHLGIPSVDLGFKGDKDDAIYQYHSNYDSYSWMEKFGDPGFVYHNVAAKYLSLLVYTLCEKELIDFKLHDYSQAIFSYYNETVKSVPKEWIDKPVSKQQLAEFTDPDLKNVKYVKKATNGVYGSQYCQIRPYPEFDAPFSSSNRIEKMAGARLGEGRMCDKDKRHGNHHDDDENEHRLQHEDGHHKSGHHMEEHHEPMFHKPGKSHNPDKPHKPHKPHNPDHHKNHTLGELLNLTWKDLHTFNKGSEVFDLESAGLQTEFENRDSLHWWQKVKLHFRIKHQNKLTKYFERNFLYAHGLHKRSWFKHIVYASGRFTGYAGQTLPGLKEAIEDDDYRQFVKWLGIFGKTLRRVNAQVGTD